MALLQADKGRNDFYAIKSGLEAIQKQLAELPTRARMSRILCLATASIWACLAVVMPLMR